MFGKKKITRIEIIGKNGREMVKQLPDWQRAEVHYQDNGRTLKIFIEDKLDEHTLDLVEKIQPKKWDGASLHDRQF